MNEIKSGHPTRLFDTPRLKLDTLEYNPSVLSLLYTHGFKEPIAILHAFRRYTIIKESKVRCLCENDKQHSL